MAQPTKLQSLLGVNTVQGEISKADCFERGTLNAWRLEKRNLTDIYHQALKEWARQADFVPDKALKELREDVLALLSDKRANRGRYQEIWNKIPEIVKTGSVRGFHELSDKEREVLLIIKNAPAISNETIAQKMGITESTVKDHLRSVYRKLAITGGTGTTKRAMLLTFIR